MMMAVTVASGFLKEHNVQFVFSISFFEYTFIASAKEMILRSIAKEISSRFSIGICL